MRTKSLTGLPSLAERLLVSRRALKLSQARLCRLANINPQAWNNSETGKARLGLDSAMRLCEQTGLTLDWIYRGVRVGLPMELREAIAEEEARACVS